MIMMMMMLLMMKYERGGGEGERKKERKGQVLFVLEPRGVIDLFSFLCHPKII